ncbi:MAG: LTA synthase family protein [Bacilli bacterium]|nr:LTA synthase family protein [Bacilli bacterium]
MRKQMRDIKKKIINFNFKQFSKKTITDLINFVNYNRMFMAYLILALISCFLIRKFTINDHFNLYATFFDFSIIMILGSLGYLFKVKNQYRYWNTILIVITLINLINGIYYKFFTNFVTVGLLESLGQTGEVTDAVFSRLDWKNFVYLLAPIIFIVLHIYLKKKDYFNYVEKVENSKKLLGNVLIIGVICLFVNISTLEAKDVSRLTKQWNREYIVQRFGIVIYQVNDIIQTTVTHLSTIFGKEEAYDRFNEYYKENPYQESSNKYTNLLSGYNVISIHLESIMNFLIGLKINGEEVTPNLNKLVNESMYFNNFYSQVSVGTSSDAEFTLNTSLMPVQSGTVFVSYYNRTYQSLESLLNEKNYYTFSMHGNKASMWNRDKMYPYLGYQRFYAEEDYNIDEIVGLGLSDKSFFKQNETKLEEIQKMVDESDNFNNYMGTLIMLSNHTPWQDPIYLEGEDAFDINYHTGKIDPLTKTEIVYDYLEGSGMETLGRYIRAAHYADEQLGTFINYVKTSGKYNNTLFMLYGDHAAQIGRKQFSHFVNFNPETGLDYTQDDPNYIDFDQTEFEIYKKVPFILWTPNGRLETGKISYPMGMIDVLPTVSNMLGLKPTYALGNDIFNIKNNNTIVFPNGNFITDKVYYYSSKGTYKLLKEDKKTSTTFDIDYITNKIQYTEDILQISNDIIVYDLLKEQKERSDSSESK